jgi:beta-glucanase (GH16 family)
MRMIWIFVLALAGSCKKNNTPTDTPAPTISAQDRVLAEGNAGSTSFDMELTLNHAYTQAVEVKYSLVEGTALNGEDFTAVSNAMVTIPAGQTSVKIMVPVVGDDKKEGDDVFTLALSSATNAQMEKATATGTIVNDDTRVPFGTAGYTAPTSYPGYTLAWSDEFNTNSLNLSSWTFQNGDGCPGLCGWGNNELEYYTDRPDNLFFQDGSLIIEAKKEYYSGKNYTSSKILTSGKKSFTFGRIDIRAILPKGQGIWPAFWMLPQNNVFGGWPRSGEIDMMELIGHEPNRVYATLHFGPGPASTQIGRNYTLPSGLFNDQFHVFSVEWKQDQIKWYVDGILYSTVNKADLGANTYPFNEAFYLIFNLAVGGYWPGNPNAATYFPQWLIVDYVRLYQ